MKPIPYGRQQVTKDDLDAVNRVLQTDFLTQGPEVPLFEKNFAEYVGAKHAVAVANGTAALHLSVLALGLEKGQKVITTPITFAASANCVAYAGGELDFVDIHPDTYLMDLDKLVSLLSANPKGTYAGVVPVDFAGHPIEMDKLRKIADDFGLWILEDACHAPGGKFIDNQGYWQHCGNGQYADAAIFSFHPVKHIACGEGGMITTNHTEVYDRLAMLRTHGITKSPDLLEENHGGWYYEMHELGYNYRLTDMQAALGNSQLSRADEGIAKRQAIAKRYDEAFRNMDLVCPQNPPNINHAYHLYVVLAEDRKGLYNHLRTQGIYAQVHYIPVHLMPFYKRKGWKKGDFPVAEQYYEKCLSLPMYPSLSEEQQDYVIEQVKAFLN